MKKLIVVLMAVLVMVASANAAYTFGSDNENWGKGEIILDSYEQQAITQGGAAWGTETSGNGYIYETATSAVTTRPYGLGIYREDASNGLFGDLTNQSIQVDFKRLGDDFQTLAGSAPTVKWVISDATSTTSGYQEATWYISKFNVSLDLNGDIGSTWATKSLAMTADNFFLFPNGITDGSEVSFNDLIQDNYNFVGFSVYSSAADNSDFGGSYDGSSIWRVPDYGAYSTGDSSTLCIDNVNVVPEPATMCLLGLGGLLVRRRKHC